MRNEIVKNMSNNEYHSIEGLSSTRLGTLLDCPARYYAEYLDPNKPKEKEKPHFSLGNAVHSLVLEPNKFFEDNYIAPKLDKRTKFGKEEYPKHIAAAGHRNIIEADKYFEAKEMADSLIKRIPWLAPTLKNAGIEHSFFWVDEDTGVQLKSRPDAYTEDFYIEIKTTSSIAGFPRSVYEY